jgi:hypothetical protein
VQCNIDGVAIVEYYFSPGFNDVEVALYRIGKGTKNIEMPTPNTLISYGI